MHKNNFTALLNNRVLVADGATGSNLQQRGLEKGEPGEKWVLDNPNGIKQLYSDFVNAGSDIILSCTFGASEFLLKQHDLYDRQEEIVTTTINLAKEAINGREVLIAGSMGPLGQLLQPLGLLSKEEAYQAYYSLANLLAKAGADILLVETQFDINEASIGVKAASAASDLPVICSFSFDRGTRTMMGVNPANFAQEIGALDVQALGINCGKSIEQNLEVLSEIKINTELPIWFKPNAGLPEVDSSGKTIYPASPEVMADMAIKASQLGANIIGGCCGTTPEHIEAISEAIKA